MREKGEWLLQSERVSEVVGKAIGYRPCGSGGTGPVIYTPPLCARYILKPLGPNISFTLKHSIPN